MRELSNAMQRSARKACRVSAGVREKCNIVHLHQLHSHALVFALSLAKPGRL